MKNYFTNYTTLVNKDFPEINLILNKCNIRYPKNCIPISKISENIYFEDVVQITKEMYFTKDDQILDISTFKDYMTGIGPFDLKNLLISKSNKSGIQLDNDHLILAFKKFQRFKYQKITNTVFIGFIFLLHVKLITTD